jgi:hypothetical protein
MDVAHGYVAQVDRILTAAVSLFPAHTPTADVRRATAPTGGDIPEGGSRLAAATEEATGRYRSGDARAAALCDAVHEAVTEAAAHASRASESARTIAQAAGTRARAVLAEGSEPHNLVLLVRQMDSRLAAMQEHIDQTRQKMHASAQKIGVHAAEMAATRRP